MDRRQYLVGTGIALSTGLAGCLGGGGSGDSGPDEPVVDGITVETSPSIRITVDVRNPTEESVQRTVWLRVPDNDGNNLATDSQTVMLPADETGAIPFPYADVAWSGTEIDEDNVEAVLTEPGAESPF